MTTGIPLAQMADGLCHGAVRFAVIAFDPEGNLLNVVSQDMQLNLRPENYDAYLRAGLQFSQQIDLPEGQIFLRTAVYDTTTGRIGTYELPLNVTAPDPDEKAAK